MRHTLHGGELLFLIGSRAVDEGRLEEAIEHFDRAAAGDPLNPYIRLEKAQALEQLGLYVRALSLYVDVVTMESWYDRPLWRRYRRTFEDEHAFAERPASGRRSPNQGAALQEIAGAGCARLAWAPASGPLIGRFRGLFWARRGRPLSSPRARLRGSGVSPAQ